MGPGDPCPPTLSRQGSEQKRNRAWASDGRLGQGAGVERAPRGIGNKNGRDFRRREPWTGASCQEKWQKRGQEATGSAGPMSAESQFRGLSGQNCRGLTAARPVRQAFSPSPLQTGGRLRAGKHSTQGRSPQRPISMLAGPSLLSLHLGPNSRLHFPEFPKSLFS